MTIHQEYGITIAYESFLMLQTAHALGKLEICTFIILCSFWSFYSGSFELYITCLLNYKVAVGSTAFLKIFLDLDGQYQQ